MADTEADRKKAHRSPAYPGFGLEAAIGYGETIYKHEKRSAAPVAVVAQHCGTDIKSSKGLRIIAALKQYGLVVEIGGGDDRQVRLSERALDILLSELGSNERRSAIAQAALGPAIHSKIWSHFEGKLPSDATLRSYLLRQLAFNDTYVDAFIKQFRATLDFASLGESDIIGGDPNDQEESQEDAQEAAMTETLDPPPLGEKLAKPPPPPAAGLKDFPLYTSVQKGALYAPAKMSKADFELFKRQLDSCLLVIEATSVVPD
jgi:hypothetical protein